MQQILFLLLLNLRFSNPLKNNVKIISWNSQKKLLLECDRTREFRTDVYIFHIYSIPIPICLVLAPFRADPMPF